MSIEEFCEELVECLEGVIQNVDIIWCKEEINNGIPEYFVVIRQHKSQVIPGIRVSNLYPLCKDGDYTTDEIADLVKEWWLHTLADVADIPERLVWDDIKDCVFCAFVNYERNKKRLKDIPHTEYLDLAIICKVLMCCDGDKPKSIEVSNKMLEDLGVSEEELFDVATKNTEEMFFPNISDCMGCGTYNVTNDIGTDGAIVMLYEGFLKSVANMLQKDVLYIAPVSTNQVVIDIGGLPLSEMQSGLRMTNCLSPCPEEVLSDHIYRYNAITDKIDIAI